MNKKYCFVEGKLYQWGGGCLYVKKRNRRSLRVVLIERYDRIHLGGRERKMEWFSPIECTLRFDVAMWFRPPIESEFVELKGKEIFAMNEIKNYKCPLVFTGTYGKKLKELRDAGVEFGKIYMELIGLD